MLSKNFLYIPGVIKILICSPADAGLLKGLKVT